MTSEYDIIFAGGGTTACLIAGRLAAADPTLKILLIEAGEHTRDDPLHRQPARYLNHIGPDSTRVSFNVSNPSEHVAGRSVVSPSGRCVGGGSSVNFTMYTRAAASDYDDWEMIYKNPGWGSKDLLPLLKKTETYQVASNKPTHGYSGPLKVSYGGIYTNIGKDFLDVAEAYDKTRGSTDDVNDLYNSNVYGRWQKWIDAESGRRSDVPHHFIYNQDHNKNLQLLTGHKVKRVIFEGIRAVGLEYVPDTTLKPTADQTAIVVKASKLVVLSAGAFGSPAILERSGVGSETILERYGVPLVSELRGVGEDYQDHNLVFTPYIASDQSDSHDALFRGEKEENDRLVKQWTTTGQGLLAHNGLDSGIKLRPTSEELASMSPAFDHRWETYFANAPDKPVMFLGTISAFLGDPSIAHARKYFSLGYFTEYPVSMGSVHIKSTDPNQPLNFNAGYLQDDADVVVLRWAYKRAREIAKRMKSYRGDLVMGHPVFAKGSSAATSDEHKEPFAIYTPDIVYSEDDDKAIDEYHRKVVQTAWHSLGTCAMKPRDAGGVVDSRLNVYGVQGLKVADMSIAPGNVGANTYSTACTIGEKAALIIAEELGIEGV